MLLLPPAPLPYLLLLPSLLTASYGCQEPDFLGSPLSDFLGSPLSDFLGSPLSGNSGSPDCGEKRSMKGRAR